jgi:glucokinase
MITLGTGVGGGVIIDGRLIEGFNFAGGELGHMVIEADGVPCSCGNHGCLERYCSATAIIRMGREAVKIHPDSLLLRLADNNPSNINAKTVFDAARQEDPVAVEVYHRFIGYLAQAVASVVNLIDPEVIVIGGGVSKAGTFLLKPLIREFPRYVLFDDQPLPEIKLAVLGSEAGIIGAAMLS